MFFSLAAIALPFIISIFSYNSYRRDEELSYAVAVLFTQ
jgi:hypothetical protein